MTQLKVFTAAAIAASVVAISPSLAQHRSHAMTGGSVSTATTAGAPAKAAPASGTAAANVGVGANTRTAQMNGRASSTTWQGQNWNGGRTWNGGNWNGGNFATNNWTGNWNGRTWDHRFHRGPGFAFGFGVGAGYGPYYDDYAYNGYPYDTYAYYNDPYYSDTFAYDAEPTVGVAVTTGEADPGYCMRRFRSYDPASGTYLGYDGIRHPCP